MVMEVDTAALEAAVVRFCRLAREHGMLVGAEESADAMRALTVLDLGDRDDVHAALRVLLASRGDELALFDRLFDEFWSAVPAAAGTIPRPRIEPPRPRERAPSISLDRWLAAPRGDLETAELKAASAGREGAPTPFVSPTREESRAVERAASALVRRLANSRSRRWRTSSHGARIDLRGSMRASLSVGGELARLARHARRRRKLRLVSVCDVSGSMDLYTRFFLQFIAALQRRGGVVETFVFATRLSRITDQLARGPLHDMLDRIPAGIADWSAGTRIGESLKALDPERFVTRDTVIVVLSDGWDTGDPALLAAVLRRLAKRCRRIVWLNPLLGSRGFRPMTTGLQAAAPHVDVFAPLHDLNSLRALPRLFAP